MANYQSAYPHHEQGYPIYLLTTPLKYQSKYLRFTKPHDMIGHWAICIEGHCYELTRNSEEHMTKKDPKYIMRSLPQKQWEAIKDKEERFVQWSKGPVGHTARPWSPQTIEQMAYGVWQGPLQAKYVYDENNCQVFIRLLVDLIGNNDTKANFPAFFDKLVKGVGVTRDSFVLAAAAGMITVAAGASLVAAPVDGGATAAAGFALASSMTLRSTSTLLNDRHSKGEFVRKAQEELKEELRREGILPY
ncbi:hypothetical protein QQZ08_000533 [Neonectria magnoliae]|uniref:Uncharacterized protein n=1 Tax=Neonectria magnoliae TaxID=2732573 RepID=A0ABR1IIR2_9HYPO